MGPFVSAHSGKNQARIWFESSYDFQTTEDRKTFHDLKIEQLQDVFFNTNWMYKEQDKPLEWWQSYPIEYSNWIKWEEYSKYHNMSRKYLSTWYRCQRDGFSLRFN